MIALHYSTIVLTYNRTRQVNITFAFIHFLRNSRGSSGHFVTPFDLDFEKGLIEEFITNSYKHTSPLFKQDLSDSLRLEMLDSIMRNLNPYRHLLDVGQVSYDSFSLICFIGADIFFDRKTAPGCSTRLSQFLVLFRG